MQRRLHLHRKIKFMKMFAVKFIKRQECIRVGCVPSAAVAVCWDGGWGVCQGGVCRGVSVQGVSAQGVSALGVSAWRGVYPGMHWGRHPPVNRMTDRCKSITFPQLRLRTVIRHNVKL